MAYNRLDILSRVRIKIKDQAYSATAINGFIDDAQQEIAELYPFECLSTFIEDSLSTGDYVFTLDDEVQSIKKLILVDPDDTGSHRDLSDSYLPLKDFLATFPVPDSRPEAQPVYWTQHNTELWFNCPPDKDYDVRIVAQKIPADLAEDTSIPDLPISFREALVLGAAYRCEEERDNYDIAATLKQRFEDKVSDIINRSANTTMAAPDTVIIGGRPSWGDEW